MKRAMVMALVLVSCSSSTDEICNDGIDNDHANGADCADPKCAIGAACGPNGLVCSAEGTCTACTGNGGVAEAKETICGDGLDNDCDGRVDCDDPDCQPVGTSSGALCDATGGRCGTPDALGHATCGSSGGGGGGGGGSTALGTIRFVGSDLYVLGTEGSGFQEQALLTFAVTASDGRPYAGLTVSFSHRADGGSFIGSTPACAGTPATCTASAVTDGDGRASVLLTSGRRYALLSVAASATALGVTRNVTAGGITVVGATPNGAHLSLDCEVHNVPALVHHDCLYSNYCGALDPVRCTVKLADRFGTVVGVPTRVSFRAEAGAVSPTTVSPAFDAARPAGDQPEVGHAVGIFEVCNSPLPWDVAPLPGEGAIVRDWGCGTRTANPRDGLVTLVAMVDGEEGWVDLNLNGRYDVGEPFVDLGEPFVDADDDGVRGPSEWYFDADGDGTHGGPNGRWDAHAVLWTQTRLLYTGYPARAQDAGGNELLSRFYLTGTPPAPTPPAPPFSVAKGPPPTSVTYGVWFSDQNMNPLTSVTDYAVKSGGAVSAALSGPFGTADSIGASFRQLYCAQPTFAAATCRDGPADQACTTSPCYVVWDVASCRSGTCAFQYGNPGSVRITGAEVGSDVVSVSATIGGVTASFGLSGVCVP